MCGIVASFSKHGPPTGAEVAHLLQAQYHRGPDHQTWQTVGPHAALGSVRLSITDAHNPLANMPLTSACGRYVVVFNGEIYNHASLRPQLTYPFQTHSDTETLLAAFIEWGEAMLPRLHGMFAFVIYDKHTQQAFCAADPTGQKTLYYYQDTDVLLLTSEIEPLISNPHRSKSWNVPALREFIAQRMINGTHTHIAEISKFEPGTSMWVSPQGTQNPTRYHTYTIGDETNANIPEICQHIASTTEAACTETFNLEVPYGHLLSGGIDSSIVTHYAKAHGLSLSTYSIGFTPFQGDTHGIPSTFNEFDHSRFIANHLGTQHTEITLTPREYRHNIDKWIAICGEPLESAEAPMLVKLFETIAPNHKVIFSGSGPDEAFDGYGYGQALSSTAPDDIAAAYYDTFHWSFGIDLNQAIPGHASVRQAVIARINAQLAPYRAHTSNPLQLTQLINLHNRLATYEFRQLDTLSMRHGIEVRSPLANTSLYTAAFNFNPALKAHNGIPKYIFKESMRGILPNRVIDRPKEGFPTPIQFWFSNEFEDCLTEVMRPTSLLFTLKLLDEPYMRSVYASAQTDQRYFFYRLYCLHKLLERQQHWLEKAPAKAEI
ncbi:MAG: asparagine synthase (glutamine-hydrolyzing) [Alphaproteobacteria bacterium]|nr:MAG: asparagine synthase (glutamine-hydrolyzing) [Alphaproteobacteria bacterium]